MATCPTCGTEEVPGQRVCATCGAAMLSTSAICDDSTAALGAGGIVFTKAPQIRMAVEALAVPHTGSASQRVTISVGGVMKVPQPGEDMKQLIEAADLALYRAKRDGRNRVEVGT